jgi:hypothetical protein
MPSEYAPLLAKPTRVSTSSARDRVSEVIRLSAQDLCELADKLQVSSPEVATKFESEAEFLASLHRKIKKIEEES